MKIVITGSASGIGKALLEKFKQHEHTVIGYDIVDGNDITHPIIINRLIQDCNDADIFINNALPNQSILLEMIHDLWKNKHKIIVNISSAVTYMYGPNNYPEGFAHYYEYKQMLNQKTKELQRKALSPQILNVRPGWVDTPSTESFEGIKMKPESLANLIYKLVEKPEVYQVVDIVVR
jgi:NAD(P)-dependent dehydrogenase (short-subunit alcohol dehydrogenase family)